jgi:hypothetical protein
MERENHRGRARGQMFDDAPPRDIEAERAVLAVVLLEPQRITDVTAALEPADFHGSGPSHHVHSNVKPPATRIASRCDACGR